MKNKKPNIIFILIDDMGWTDLSCFGSSFYETPNIDKLAKEGIIYNNAYAASPVCSPSRASIMTGLYPLNVGITNWVGAGLEKGKVIGLDNNGELGNQYPTIAKKLSELDYDTWHVGKWHLGDDNNSSPEDNGFDINIGGSHYGRPINGYFSPYDLPKLENGPKGEYLTDRITNEAITLLKNKSDNPFFLNLWYYTVHTPIQAKQDTIEKYKKKRIELGLDKIIETKKGEYFPSEHKKQWRVERRLVQSDPTYAAMVEHLDENIGKLVETLKQEGLFEDTIIFFTSDNGGLSTAEGCPTSNKPLSEGKGWMYEGGVRVPLFVWWNNNLKPQINKTIVNSTDYYNTILSLLDATPDKNDSFDFKESLSGTEIKRPPLFWYYPHYGNQGGTPYAAVRVGNYKLIRLFEDNVYELYDLSNDISEQTMLSSSHEKFEELKILLNKWLDETNAYIPVKNEAGFIRNVVKKGSE